MEKIRSFFFENSNTRQTIIKNTFWLFIGEASGRLLKMLLIVYAARKLGAEGWGTFAYALSVASLLMILSDVGIGTLITRNASQKDENYRTFISAALLLKGIVLAISIILVILISPHISNIKEAVVLFPIIGLIFLFDSIRDVGFAINRMLEKMEREMIIKVIMNSIILVLGITLIKANPLPISIAVAYVIGSGVSAVLIIWILRKDILEFIVKINVDTLKLVIKTTLPLAIVVLVGTIMGNTDIYMLGIWKTPEEIGIYSAAQRFFQFIIIIPSMIATATLPLMSRLANKDNEKFKKVLENTLSLFMVIVIPIALGGLILASQIIPFTFGPQYLTAIPVLQILMVMLLVSSPLILLINSVFAYNEQRKLVSANIFGVLINILFNLLLIPRFGVTGAALATLASTSIVTYVVWRKMKKINYFEILPSFKGAIVPTIVMLLITLILKHFEVKVMLNIIISSIFYFWVLFLVKKSILVELKEILKV